MENKQIRLRKQWFIPRILVYWDNIKVDVEFIDNLFKDNKVDSLDIHLRYLKVLVDNLF